jgi:predicted transcriptional regulator
MRKPLFFLLCFSLLAVATTAQTGRTRQTQRAQALAADETTSLGMRYETEATRGDALHITPDVAFERVHFLFSSAIEEIEEKQLSPELGEILDELEEGLRNARNRATDDAVRELLERNEAHIQVARCLLDSGATPAPGRVAEELKLILAADKAALSPVMGYMEDYTQYITRGHYTKNEGLERYFRTMTWLGRAAFYVETNSAAGIDERLATRLTAQAMLLIAVASRDKSAVRKLAKFESTLTALIGESDDLILSEAGLLISHVAGERWADENDYATAINARQIARTRAWMLSNARRPRILGAHAAEGRVSPPLSIRVIGQRFSADSYVFQSLTFDRVKDLTLSESEQKRWNAIRNGPSPPGARARDLLATLSVTRQKRLVRGMPRGLDFLMALGSKLAWDELAKGLDDRYAGYMEQSDRLRSEIPSLLKSSDSFASRYMIAIQNLLRNETPLSLNCALGAWILLRYDLSAYAKQSYTSIPKALEPRRPTPVKLPPIYVAPAASAFKELARAVEIVAE